MLREVIGFARGDGATSVPQALRSWPSIENSDATPMV